MPKKVGNEGKATGGGNRVRIDGHDFVSDAEKVETLLQSSDQARMKIGEYIGRQYYSDSRNEFEDHRTKNYSLLKLVEILAERKNVKVSRSTLHNFVAAYFQEGDLGLDPDQAQHLSFAARVALLPVKDAADKKDLVRHVIRDHLTVRELRDLIRGDEAPAKKTPVQRLKVVAAKALSLAEICTDTTSEKADDLSAAIGVLGSALQLLMECHQRITKSVHTFGH